MEKPRNISQLKKWASKNIGTKLFLHYDRRRAVRKIITLTNANASSLHFIDEFGRAYKIPYPKKGHYTFTTESFSLKTLIFKYQLPNEKKPPAQTHTENSEKTTVEYLSDMTFDELDQELSAKIIRKLWALAYKHGFTNNGDTLILPDQAYEIIRSSPVPVRQLMVFGREFEPASPFSHRFHLMPVVRDGGFQQEFHSGKQFPKYSDMIYHNRFDLVIGMPGYEDQKFEELSSHELLVTQANTLAEYYITRGLDLLKPGGVLVYHICAKVDEGEELFLDSPNNTCKEKIAAKADLLQAYRLPTVSSSDVILNNEIVIIRKTVQTNAY